MRVAVAVTWYGDGNSVEVEGVVQVCVCVVCTVVHECSGSGSTTYYSTCHVSCTCMCTHLWYYNSNFLSNCVPLFDYFCSLFLKEQYQVSLPG
jgi:hypothetical protein